MKPNKRKIITTISFLSIICLIAGVALFSATSNNKTNTLEVFYDKTT